MTSARPANANTAAPSRADRSADRDARPAQTRAQNSAQRPGHNARWLILAAPALLALVLYAKTATVGFFYDDHKVIEEEARLRTTSGVFDITLKERPVRLISLWLDYRIFGPNPAGFHIVNALMHGGVGVLVLLYAASLLRSAGPFARSAVPLIAATLFVVHPIQSESVICVSHRKEMLATGFVLLALWRALGRPLTAARIAEVAAWFALGVFSKASALAAVPILFVQEWLVVTGALGAAGWRANANSGAISSSSSGERRSKASAPAARSARVSLGGLARRHALSLALVAAPVIVTGAFFIAEKNEVRRGVVKLSEFQSTKTAKIAPPAVLPARLFVEYISLLAWPMPLLLERPTIRISGPADPLVIGGAAAWAAMLGLAWWQRRRPLVAMGLAWWALAPLPTLNFIPLSFPIADRYVYLPAVGFAMLVAFVIAGAAERLAPRRAALVAALVTAAIAVPSSAAVLNRIDEWQTEVGLLEATIRDNPRAAEALRHSSRLAKEANDTPRALAFARRAIDAAPTASESWGMLGDVFWDAGQGDSARTPYETEWDLRNTRTETANRLGIYAAERGDGAGAVKWFRSALRRSPGDRGVRENLARALIATDQTAEARTMLDALLAEDPKSADAWAILAYSFWHASEPESARAILFRGLRELPQDPKLLRFAAQWGFVTTQRAPGAPAAAAANGAAAGSAAPNAAPADSTRPPH
ncbi:MAG: tetratricopeptide repeat protein [bacterium]